MAASIHHGQRSQQPRQQRQHLRQPATAAQTFAEALARAEADFRAATQRASALRAHERAATVPLSEAPAQVDAEDGAEDADASWSDTAAARVVRSTREAAGAWYLPSIIPLWTGRLGALGEWLRGRRRWCQTVRKEGTRYVRGQHLDARLRLGGDHPAVLPTADDCLWALAEVRGRDLPTDLRRATAALWQRQAHTRTAWDAAVARGKTGEALKRLARPEWRGEAWDAAVATLLAACDLRLVAQSDGAHPEAATHYHVTTASPAQLAQVGYHLPALPHLLPAHTADSDRTPRYTPSLDTADAVDDIAEMRARFYDPNETQPELPTVATDAPSPLGLMTTLGAVWPTAFTAPATTSGSTSGSTSATGDPAQTHQALPASATPATTAHAPYLPLFAPGTLPAASLMDPSLVDRALVARMAPATHPLPDATVDTTDDKEGDTTTC